MYHHVSWFKDNGQKHIGRPIPEQWHGSPVWRAPSAGRLPGRGSCCPSGNPPRRGRTCQCLGPPRRGTNLFIFGGLENTHVGQKKKYLLSCSGFKIIFQEFDRCPTLKILIIHFWVSNFDPFLPQEFKLTKLVGITSRCGFKFGANGPTKYNWLVQVWRYGCTTQLLSDKWQGRPFSCNGDVDLWIAVSIKLLCWSLQHAAACIISVQIVQATNDSQNPNKQNGIGLKA